MANKEEKKIGLLLMPDNLLESFSVVQTIQIHKTITSIDTFIYDVDRTTLTTTFTKLPFQAIEYLQLFCEKAIKNEQQNIEKKYAKQRAGINKQAFGKNAMMRYLHESFSQLKPYLPAIKWYHKVLISNTKNYRVAACIFSQYKPILQFVIKKLDNKFTVFTNISLNGTAYPLSSFTRNHFLLQSNNEYFFLSYKDYQTIEWLEQNGQQYNTNEQDFVDNIVTILEADYLVESNNLFAVNEISPLPINRILLSELNNSFLMLTPQWLYDGLVVEGPFTNTIETTQNAQKVTIKRNKEAEESLLKIMEDVHPNFTKQRNGYYYVTFAEATKKQWFLKAYHQLLALDIEFVGMDMLKHFKYSPFKATTNFSILQQTDSKVLLQLQTLFGKEKIPLKELQKILFAGQKAVLLKDGSLGVFDNDWIKQFATIIKHGKIEGENIEVSRWLAITEDNADNNNTVLHTVVQKDWRQLWLQWQSQETPIYSKPSTIQATLRPYQQKGFEWIALLADIGAGACLADDMGLGKTLQTICFIAHYIQLHPTLQHIIICPSSLIFNWQQEFEKFAPSIKTLVYHGNQKKETDVADDSIKVIITTYGTIRVDNGMLLTKKYGVAVVDESHNIKNPSAQITKAIASLQAIICIALSGTPVVNNTFDLFAQLNFALPGMFGSKDFFKREYADAIDKYQDEEKIKQLQKLTNPFILRRTKEQVAKDLPAKTESILWCTMHPQQKMVYDDISEQIRGNLLSDIKTKGLGKSKLAVLQGIMKLRQVCNTPLLLPTNEQQHCTESIKTEMLFNELNNILGEHKAIVFSQFSSMLDLLAIQCEAQGIAYFHFDGQTPPAKRAEMVTAFQQKDCTTHLFLISLKAGNVGLNLTAADYVFLFDPWWNTAVEQQAIDRTHRIGQTQQVFAYKLICKNTIEEKIIALQQRKKLLADELVTEDEGFVKSLTEEDVQYLFS